MTISDIVKRIRQEALRRVGAEIQQQIHAARNYVMQLRPRLEKRLK